jgi:tetratricopeptide (TPR) repeat protein
LEKAVDKDPRSPVFHYHLGIVLYGMGDREKARENFKKAIESGEDFEGKEEAVKTLEQLQVEEAELRAVFLTESTGAK